VSRYALTAVRYRARCALECAANRARAILEAVNSVTQALCTDLTHLKTSERGESCWVSGIKNQSVRGARRKPHRKIRYGAAGAGGSCDLVEECRRSVGRTPEYKESRSPTRFAMCSQDSVVALNALSVRDSSGA
jgi:hypothetical protein